MKTLISMLTMKKTNKPYDEASWDGKQMWVYKDVYGQEWIASSPYYPSKLRLKHDGQ